MAVALRKLVSKKKKRYEQDGYSLDLVYITRRIVAMGFPASGLEAAYRNPATVVRRFLDERHENHYWVWNFCEEQRHIYDAALFDGRVTQMGFSDHEPPEFRMIHRFCEAAKAWMDEDPANIVVTHCKAGKGRTGLMICALMLYLGIADTAQHALDKYAKERTLDGKGVTIPSQKRYIEYYGLFVGRGCEEVRWQVTIRRIVVTKPPEKWLARGVTLGLRSRDGSSTRLSGVPDRPHWSVEWDLGGNGPTLAEDFVLEFVNPKGDVKCWFWLNSNFVPDGCQVFVCAELDKAWKKEEYAEMRILVEWSRRRFGSG